MPDMPRCRDCRWWKQFQPGVNYEQGYWGDRLIGKGECEIAASSSSHEPDYLDTLAIADSDCPATSLITSPDFGCVQFEAKPFEGGDS